MALVVVANNRNQGLKIPVTSSYSSYSRIEETMLLFVQMKWFCGIKNFRLVWF